ncbi:hypothetical protein NW762_003694 [Fusarium torreyae]|uniref:Uncharacterized protein n=1 Tax=Fusarium torreyae TaxID=1237075 RepID=A0A9W8SB89_9HYPO|nr:hypothetical protein NW762_003694 [Fusarium torreyae]
MDPRHPPKLPFSPSPYAAVSPFPSASPTTSSSTANGLINKPSAGSAPASATAVYSSRASPQPQPSYGIARAESHPHFHVQNLSPDQNLAYAAHNLAQRRPSDTTFYPPTTRQLTQDSNNARPQGSSATHSLRTLNREMPPPTSPPQPGAKPPQPPQQPHNMMAYGPPPPRAPPVAVGPPMSFPSGRELPALSSIARTGSSNSSMSISSMLGGPPPALRESQPPPSHFPPHSAPVSGPGFATAVHASPRMHSAASDYPPFRRPQTPDHQRPYEPRNSPPGHYSTPEVPRYSTPSAYSRHPSGSADHAREPGRLPPGPPPRPSSQPKAYPGMPPRPMEMGRPPGPEEAYGRRDEMGRPPPGMEYNPERVGLRPNPYEDRYRAERERMGEVEQRERERRERAYSGSDSGRHSIHPGDYGHREPPRNPLPYGRPPERDPREIRDPRDAQARDPRDMRERDPREAQWGRPGPDPSYRAPMDHQRQHPDYPPSTAPYPPHGLAYQGPPPDRYPPVSHPPPGQNMPPGPAPYESPDRNRMSLLHAQQQPPHRRPEEGPPPPTIAYNGAHGPGQFESPRHRNSDDASAPNGQRNLLAIQEMNRKGRISPLPQAVQGAQLQQPGPTGEPGIKSEFGRMFAGIGNGVMGVSSPITSAAMPFTNASLAKREDPENVTPDSGPEAGGKGTKGRRRKLKDEDGKVDDESSGRATPANRAKRPKTHQHHHHHHHPHHHHHHPADAAPLGGAAPFKNFKTGAPPGDKGPPVPHHHHPPRPMHPQHQPAKQPATTAAPVIPPKAKTIVSSKTVLESVANRPRHHLGDFIYEPGLKAGRLIPSAPTHRAFASNPRPLPWELIKNKENCTLTVKVARIHLSPISREEITSRGYLWGTDVYTDDSDVVAACIHSGWIKGEWTEDIDNSLLDLDQGTGDKRRKKPANSTVDLDSEGLITAPPASGPMSIPARRDLHINILILPRLVKYASSTRYGISSREFGGEYGYRHAVHDGISYMIKSVRWVENGAQPQARLRGKARRERMRKAMWEVKGSLDNINGLELEQEKERIGRLRGEISATWRKKEPEQTDPKDKEQDAVNGDKENQPTANDVETNTEDTKEQQKDVEMNDAAEAPATESKTDE